jgi:ABC transporter with metal-binding/Fe-S-binding domain ATP-binding protein
MMRTEPTMLRSDSNGIIALLSGGKDSTLAIDLAMTNGFVVSQVFTMIPDHPDSYMFHTPALNIVPYIARAIGIPLVTGKTLGIVEQEVRDLYVALKPLQPKRLIAGAIASKYQYSRLMTLCEDLGCEGYFPLWGMDPQAVVELILDRGYSVVFSAVASMGLDESWIGRSLNRQSLEELLVLNEKYGVNVAGEGGEYETLVLDAPFFNARIILDDVKTHWDGSAGRLEITNLHIDPK